MRRGPALPTRPGHRDGTDRSRSWGHPHTGRFVRFRSGCDRASRGRGPGWEDGDLEFYIKAGKDENNFYLYHAPARTGSWEPEVVVAFQRWLALRARVEQAWLRGDTARVYAGCPDTTIVPFDSAYVMCDGPYIIHVRDPGTAPPNLAAVQELAAGILRAYVQDILTTALPYGALATPIAALLFCFFLGMAVLLGAELNATVQARWPAPLGRHEPHRRRRRAAKLASEARRLGLR